MFHLEIHLRVRRQMRLMRSTEDIGPRKIGDKLLINSVGLETISRFYAQSTEIQECVVLNTKE